MRDPMYILVLLLLAAVACFFIICFVLKRVKASKAKTKSTEPTENASPAPSHEPTPTNPTYTSSTVPSMTPRNTTPAMSLRNTSPEPPTEITTKYISAARISEARENENAVMHQGNDKIQEAQGARRNCNYYAAIAIYQKALDDSILPLCKVDATYYEPYLYAVLDEMAKIYLHDLKDRANARRYFKEAYYYCKKCANRNPGGTASRDLSMLETYLTNPSYLG